jgi:parallel beta-helix repeat protein
VKVFYTTVVLGFFMGCSQSDTKTMIGVRNTTPSGITNSSFFMSVDGNGTECTKSDPCNFSRLGLFSTNKFIPKAGDTIFFREGVYSFAMNGVKRIYLSGGTKDKPIIYESFPNEKVIFDGSQLSRDENDNEAWKEGRLELRGSHIKLRRVEVRNMPQYGVKILGNYNVVEGCKLYNNGLSGLEIFNFIDKYSIKPTGGSYNLVQDNMIYNNSDVDLKHHNYNNGGNADGITIHSGVANLITHNDIYDNSDDGIDVWRSIDSVIEYNKVHHNGKGEEGNGHGIKLGGAPKESPLGANAIARYNISYSNLKSGVNINGGKNVLIEYNTAYNNKEYGYAIADDTKLVNNMSIDNQLGHVGWSEGLLQSSNSWQIETKVKFISVNSNSEDFLRPVDNIIFANIGAYGVKKKEDSLSD